ncbi:MAG: serine/threonine-protein kinase [Planctomycetota bacterium]
MTGERPLDPGDTAVPEGDHDPNDSKMAELLASGRPGSDLRKQLEQTSTPEGEDLLSRLNALDFLSGVVGEGTDMPERLGDYRITGLLGRGGMGTVYLAYQEELEREVALKVLAPAWSSDPTMRQRFRAEARATAALHHRHIVPIYDYGEAQGRLFFAMERVDGLSLDKHINAARRRDQRPLDPREAARRFAGVADALGLAHRRRLLHRDVKPGNILVAADGTLALTDFGLAKALDQGSMRLTSKSGGFLGTLHYSSPEQAMGGNLTPASDLYSLGVTIYEAVSGELPLSGKTTENVLQQILYGTPRRLRDVLPKPPKDLEAVIDKLLSREPGDRYQDGEELARDLARIADGDPVHIRKLPMVVRLLRRVRKNPVLSGAIIAASVLLFVTLLLVRVLREEKGQSLLSRHQVNLVNVANQVRSEMGSPWGPPPMLQSLIGGPPVPIASPSEVMVGMLDRVVQEVPDDTIAERMLAGYVKDPLPDASALLARGQGLEALALYDAAIGNEIAVRTFADLSVDLRLYPLYLGRASACLTASVMRPIDARRDLDLASFLRPSSVFPRALAVVLRLAEAVDVDAELAQIERELQNASADRRAVVGRLLSAMAALRPAADANLMTFPLRFAERERIHELGLRLADVQPTEVVESGAPTGRARDLHALAVQFTGNLFDAEATATFAEQLRTKVQFSVHPQSNLQGYLGAVQLLERPRSSAPLLDATGQPMPPSLELASWVVVQRLLPPRELLDRLMPRFLRFVDDHSDLDGVVPVAAALTLAARSDRAEAFARAWRVGDSDDPGALRCRAELSLRASRLDASLDDAMEFVQRSRDRKAAIATVVRLCREVAGEAPEGDRAGIVDLADRFEALLR